MISKTKISRRIKNKTNRELAKTMLLAKKNNQEIAALLALPTRKRKSFNLDQINKESKDGDTIIVAGKVLGSGNLDKKIKIVALGCSESVKEKIKKSKSEIQIIIDALKSNKKLEGKILK